MSKAFRNSLLRVQKSLDDLGHVKIVNGNKKLKYLVTKILIHQF
jgi:hypothetical protein